MYVYIVILYIYIYIYIYIIYTWKMKTRKMKTKHEVMYVKEVVMKKNVDLSGFNFIVSTFTNL